MIGIERILMHNRVGERTPSVSVASDFATAMPRLQDFAARATPIELLYGRLGGPLSEPARVNQRTVRQGSCLLYSLGKRKAS